MPDTQRVARVFVALGSNLGDRSSNLSSALLAIGELPDVSALRASSVYETDPMGPQNQPDYLNSVCEFEYTGTPQRLLNQLQTIESAHGRVKTTARWTARPLDLDILMYGALEINEPDLTIPHIGIADRSFVLWPLRELDAELRVPGLGRVDDLCEHCQQFGIRRFATATEK